MSTKHVTGNEIGLLSLRERTALRRRVMAEFEQMQRCQQDKHVMEATKSAGVVVCRFCRIVGVCPWCGLVPPAGACITVCPAHRDFVALQVEAERSKPHEQQEQEPCPTAAACATGQDGGEARENSTVPCSHPLPGEPARRKKTWPNDDGPQDSRPHTLPPGILSSGCPTTTSQPVPTGQDTLQEFTPKTRPISQKRYGARDAHPLQKWRRRHSTLPTIRPGAERRL